MHFNPFDHLGDFLSGSAAYGIVSYLARTVPPVQNRWLAWLLGGLQFAFANADKGKQHFDAAKQPKP